MTTNDSPHLSLCFSDGHCVAAVKSTRSLRNVLVVGNQLPHGLMRHEELVIRRADAPTLTVIVIIAPTPIDETYTRLPIDCPACPVH